MKKLLIVLFGIAISLIVALYSVEACQDIPTGYYKFLTLEETINHSNYIVIAEKIRDGPSIGEFPSGEAIDWMEIRVKEGIPIDPPYAYSKIKIQAPLPCGYVGGYPYLEKNKDYLIFIGEKDGHDIFSPPINAKDTSNVFYGMTAYEIVNNQIIGLDMALEDLKEEYFERCAKEGEEVNPSPNLVAGFPNECCVGLKPMLAFDPETCEGITGTPLKTCMACGDGICNNNMFENKCNCPEDCLTRTPLDFGCSENSQVKICINTTFEKEINFIIKVKKTIKSTEDCCSPYFKIEMRVNDSEWAELNVFKSHGKGCDSFIDEPIKEGCMCDPCWPYYEINPREFNFNWSKSFFNGTEIIKADSGEYKITYQGFSKEFGINSQITDRKVSIWQKIVSWFRGLFS